MDERRIVGENEDERDAQAASGPRPPGIGDELVVLLRDPDRLAALRRTGLLVPGRDEGCERITRLAARLLEAPTAACALADGAGVRWKSWSGLPAPEETERILALFALHALEEPEGLAVEETRSVAPAEPTRISFLGAPLRTFDDHAIGALCVIDHRPRPWTAEQRELLVELAAFVVADVERRALATQAARWVADLEEARASAESLADENALLRDRGERARTAIAALRDEVGAVVDPLVAEAARVGGDRELPQRLAVLERRLRDRLLATQRLLAEARTS